MATNFPTSLDTLTNPTPTSDTVTVPHSSQHANANDAIEALEAKVGVNSSAVTTSHDYKLSGVTGADKAASKAGVETLLYKTLGTGSKINIGTVALGDEYYGAADGTLTRLPIGSTGQVKTVVGGVPAWTSPSAVNTNYAVDTGAANAYVVTLVPALGSYVAGTLVQFKATNANTTTSTVNVNGLGAKTIKKLGGATDLASGDIAAGMVVELEYDGTNFIMLNPVANAPLLPTGDGSGLTGVGSKLYTAAAAVDVGTSSTAESTLLSYSLAGGILGTNNAVKVSAYITMSSGSDTITTTLRFKYGATTLHTKALVMSAGSPSSFVYKVDFNIIANASTSAQRSDLLLSGYTGTSTTSNDFLINTSSEDSTTAKNIIITAQPSTSSGNQHTSIGNVVITKII